MNSVSERIENRRDVQIDILFVPPDIGHRHRDVIGKRARPVHTHAHRMRAQMPAPGETVSAAAAHHVPFAAHYIAWMKIVHVRAGLDDLADELMTDRHGYRNGSLRPLIPVV